MILRGPSIGGSLFAYIIVWGLLFSTVFPFEIDYKKNSSGVCQKTPRKLVIFKQRKVNNK
ncbi:hypothetical protein GCM10023331_32550 [Algivirga pacifica]|uniref:Transmembrane protein n=1 Tax=Algivirga pacifica TaxID=1162670 RepID=A0ABP9DNQ1_9BACT